MYIKYTTLTISEGGRPASTRMGAILRRDNHHGQGRNTFSSFLSRVLPFPASRPMSSGHFMCMALSSTQKKPTGGLNVSADVPKHGLEGITGRLWQPKGLLGRTIPESLGGLGRFWRPRLQKRLYQRFNGLERGRAPNTARSAVWGTCVPQTIIIIEYFEHRNEYKNMVRK